MPSVGRWSGRSSKVLGPDLRVVFVASGHQTSLRLRLRLASVTTWVSHLRQDVVGVCLTCETLSSRVAQAKQDYKRRRAWLAAALADHKIPVATPSLGKSPIFSCLPKWS